MAYPEYKKTLEECLCGCWRLISVQEKRGPVPKFPRLRRLSQYQLEGKLDVRPVKIQKEKDPSWTPRHHVMELKDESNQNRFEKVSQHLRESMMERRLRPADLTFDKTYKILDKLEIVTSLKQKVPPDESSVSSSSSEPETPEEPELPSPDSSRLHSQSEKYDCDKVIAVHKFMLNEVRKFVEEFKSAPGVFYDFETARLCTGVATLVKLEDEFRLTRADLDHLMIIHRERLKNQSNFRRITDDINELLSEFDEP